MNPQHPSHIRDYHNTSVATATLIGALASAVVKSTINAKKLKEGNITRKGAIADVVKGAAQGAIATASVAAIHETIGCSERSNLNAVAYGAIGIAGVYAVEKLADRFCTTTKEA